MDRRDTDGPLQGQQAPGRRENGVGPGIPRPTAVRVLRGQEMRGHRIEPIGLRRSVAVEVEQIDAVGLQPLHHGKHRLAMVEPAGAAAARIGPMALDVIDRILHARRADGITDQRELVEQVAGLKDIDPSPRRVVPGTPIVRVAVHVVLHDVEPRAELSLHPVGDRQPETARRQGRGISQAQRDIAGVGVVRVAGIAEVAPAAPGWAAAFIGLGPGHKVDGILQRSRIQLGVLGGRQRHHCRSRVVDLVIAAPVEIHAYAVAVGIRIAGRL